MGKNRRGIKELAREQKLVKENSILKREVAKLRKRLARIDLDRYSTIKDMVEEHEMDDKLGKTQDFLDSLKEEWRCHECPEGHLEIIIYNKMNNPWYFRKCDRCQNRTQSQSYDAFKVRGIVRNKD